MLYELRLTKLNPYMTDAKIEAVYVRPGEQVQPGAKLFDVSVDLTAMFEQDCPPISYFRIVAREKGWVRALDARVGDLSPVGACLARLSSEADEPEGSAPRSLRVSTAGILHHAGMGAGAGS